MFDDVLDICGDVHPLEHAVTIGRTRRTVADGTVVDCRTALICTVFLRLFPWQSYRYHTSCGSSPTCRRVGAACLRMCSFPPPGCEGGFRGQVQLYHVHNHRLYLPGFFFYSWYDLEMGKIYLPPGLEGTNLVVYQPIGTRGQMYAQVGRCACLFAPEFPLVHDSFLEGYCVWN